MQSTADRADFQRAVDQFSDWRWRLNNLYWVLDKEGRRCKFQMNWAQESLFDEMHFLNLILKARQLGFTTFIQLFMLDACIFNSNIRAGTIAHTLGDAETIFRDKIKYPYEQLPDQLRKARPASKDTAKELVFANNSSIRVGTSLRSGTLQYLHVSEYGKVCAKFPEKAREIKSGALNTVQAGQIVFIESTAEGQDGHFFELCETAQSQQRTGVPLTELDFKFMFYPWWREPGYQIDPAGVVIPSFYGEYFGRLKAEHGIELTDAQKAWYVKKAEQQQEDMKREFPSTPKEAFEASVEGAYYGKQIAEAEQQGRIASFEFDPTTEVHTVWDIGMGDDTAIWFFQIGRKQIRIVDYYANSGEYAPHYAEILKEKARVRGFRYGRHWLPHDAKVREWGSERTRVESLVKLGVQPSLVPDHTVDDRINATRIVLAQCWFDEEYTTEGLKCLKAYRKEWNEKLGTWYERPRHDWASHGADAFGYLAMAYREMRPEKPEIKPYDYQNQVIASIVGDPTKKHMAGKIGFTPNIPVIKRG